MVIKCKSFLPAAMGNGSSPDGGDNNYGERRVIKKDIPFLIKNKRGYHQKHGL